MSQPALARALIVVSLSFSFLGAKEPTPPKARAVPSGQAVTIDARLDEPCWRRTRPFTDFYVLGRPDERSQNTVVKVAYDDAWLYFGVECGHPNMDRVEVRHFQHDGPVHTDESIEIFIDPGTHGECYFHFKLNCANVKAEQRVTAKGGRNAGWDMPWLSAARREAKGWTAEIAIPLYEIASYGRLDSLRINVTRNTLIPDVDRQGVAVGWKRQLSTWAPLIRTFHEPDLFGALEGVRVRRLRTPFLAAFDRAAIGGYRLVNGAYCYDVTLDARGYNHKPGKVRLSIIDEPVSGKGKTVTKEVPLHSVAAQAVEFLVPVAAPVQRKVTVVMADSATGAEFRRTQIAQTSSLNLISAYLDRTYYTTEPQAIVVCSLGMPQKMLRRTRLAVADAQGRTLARRAQPRREEQLPFPIANLPTGKHTIKLDWTQSSGGLIFSQSLTLTKLPPKPGREWKIDKLNKLLLRDGRPFFPFGLLMAGISSRDEEDMKKAADAGFNTVVHWSSAVSPSEVEAYLRLAKKYGLLVLGRLEACNKRGMSKRALADFFSGEALERVFRTARSCGATHLKGLLVGQPDLAALPRSAKNKIFDAYYQSTLEPILEGVRIAKEYDNIIGFDHFDEPTLSVFDQDIAGRNLYRRVRETDGYHPVFLLYSSHIPQGERALDWCDAIGTDPYWIPAQPGLRSHPNYVSKITCMTRARGDAAQKLTWIVPMAEFWSGVHKRAILPREQFCQTYLALIHGAKALFYFRYPILHQQTWDTLTRVAKQLRVLGPIAVTREVAQQVAYEPGETEVEKEVFPDVQVSLRRHPSGGYVLLAANSQAYPVDVAYTLSCLNTDSEVGRLFPKETYRVRRAGFSDHIEPYGVRAYRILRARAPGGPVRIHVVMRPDKAAALPPESWIPRSGRQGKKNVLANPSFEEASLPGWPDYYRPWYSYPLIGAEGQGWGQDPVDPVHGKYCLRITRNRRGYNGVYFYISPQHNRATRYVFSFYLRGERTGLRVAAGGTGSKWTLVRTTKSWRRYSLLCLMPARASRYSTLSLRLIDNGRVWVDALQLEQGETPTAFED